MKKIITTLLLLFAIPVFGQSDSTKHFTFSGYGELYYCFDFANPANHERPGFVYNHKRHNEINANLLLLKANYKTNHTRANLGIMAGNYAQYNLSSEPEWARFMYEANIGVKLSKQKNLWLDAGVLPSHIGFESAIGADCWTLTRSLLAENSPYYETGIKLNYTNTSEKINLAFLFLNGWQKIKKPDAFQKPSFGMQFNFAPNDKLILNYSNFLGTDKPDSLHAFRTYHNLYMQYTISKKLALLTGFDIGTDKFNETAYGTWYSPVVIIRYTINDRIRLACRGEYYSDKKQIIFKTNTNNGLQILGLSANIDYNISNTIMWRTEAKLYKANEYYFSNEANKNVSIATNLSIKI